MLATTALLLVLGWLTPLAHSYWMKDVAHQGISPFNTDKNYQVFRNVKDFGAKGDGVKDDTDAINLAISHGNRCGGEAHCVGTTVTPAVVYFPPGTYLVTSSIVDYYYTQIIGDPTNMPVIKAAKTFKPNLIGLLDGDQYTSSGALKFGATNVFFRQVRNIVFDITDVPGEACAIHWPSSQATVIDNCVFKLSRQPGTSHTGIFMEEGSGGMLSDLVFYGGEYGVQFGNQQYTTRNLTFYNSKTAIFQIWNWGWTYKSIHAYNCEVGLNMSGPVIGSVVLLDSTFSDTTTGIVTGRNPAGQQKASAGTLVIESTEFKNVATPMLGPVGPIVRKGASATVDVHGFVHGNVYTPTGPSVVQSGDGGYVNLLTTLQSGRGYLEMSKPQYKSVPASLFLSARTFSAKGDGVADDTAALNALFLKASQRFSEGVVAFVDAGYYKVTDTIYIPPNVRIVGEALASVIMGAGAKFSDMHAPYPVIQVGKPGETGIIEWSDMIVSTQGGTAGAVLIEYNLATPWTSSTTLNTPSGMWDVHVRVGGFAGSQLQLAECAKTPQLDGHVDPKCIAAYTSMHITRSATSLYMENCWLWTADHDIEDYDNRQISVFAGRGLLVESRRGRIWLVGTGVEHHALYQYQLVDTQDVWMGQIQTETPYYQPNPPAPLPFVVANAAIHDPDFDADCLHLPALAPHGTDTETGDGTPVPAPPCRMAWGLRVLDSRRVVAFGAGLYSFFNNYNTTCCNEGGRRKCQARILWVGAGTGNGSSDGDDDADGQGGGGGGDVQIYGLDTVGVQRMVTRAGLDVARFEDNAAGFADTLAMFRYSDGGGAGALGGGGACAAGSGNRTVPVEGGGYGPGVMSVAGFGGAGAGAGDVGYVCSGDWQALCGIMSQKKATSSSAAADSVVVVVSIAAPTTSVTIVSTSTTVMTMATPTPSAEEQTGPSEGAAPDASSAGSSAVSGYGGGGVGVSAAGGGTTTTTTTTPPPAVESNAGAASGGASTLLTLLTGTPAWSEIFPSASTAATDGGPGMTQSATASEPAAPVTSDVVSACP
ncbi:uncharacterized protein E0L32_007914 [Thyridium curvatum]|uniref:Rhamnogalacturonase A/B/Epimerase-like pectate lyase domain-containing protein n=1 Tax=Thyridium curvatum TaxID=1093900 RepID=A0A507ATI5_9PEZI|nr:uncharacterized protein E0L32_007914 [Thyridium curvatum]TPX11053.1 hypothetical protein E0L32_007914 [Thyridium curvatum]